MLLRLSSSSTLPLHGFARRRWFSSVNHRPPRRTWARLRGDGVPCSRFDQVAEVTLDELRIELFYPSDAAAERFFRARSRARQP
jgi:hypothetical protein